MIRTLFILAFILLNILLHAQNRDLNYYIEQAKKNSPLLNKTQNDQQIIDLDLKQVNSILSKPEINLAANVLFSPIINHDKNTFDLVSQGAAQYTGYDLGITNGGQYQALIAMNQPLFNKSKFAAYSKQSEALKQKNENSIKLTIHEIEQLVSYQYVLCLKSKLQADNVQIIKKQMDEQVKLMETLVSHAIYKQTDLYLLQIEQQNFELSYHENVTEYKNSLYDLNLLCGISDTATYNLLPVDFKMKNDSVMNSPFLASYSLDSLNLVLEQSIFELKYKPQLNWFFDAGQNAVYLPSINRFGFSTGLSFSMNIFDGKQRQIQQEKTKINLQSLDFEKNNFVKQRQIQRNKIQHQIQSLDEKEKILNRQLNQYETIVKAYQNEMAQGLVSIMELKNLVKDYAAKKQELLQVNIEKQWLINMYNYWTF